MSCRIVSRQVSVRALVLDEAIQARRTAAVLITIRPIDCSRCCSLQACHKRLDFERIGQVALGRCLIQVRHCFLVSHVFSNLNPPSRRTPCSVRHPRISRLGRRHCASTRRGRAATPRAKPFFLEFCVSRTVYFSLLGGCGDPRDRPITAAQCDGSLGKRALRARIRSGGVLHDHCGGPDRGAPFPASPCVMDFRR
jgi:hypothetical protein